ncbi:MAG: argininosuccinate lyase [Thermoproteota archaeon]
MAEETSGEIYRSRLAPSLSEATRYVSSIREDAWIFNEDIECTVAHDYMLMKQGYISDEQFRKILHALKKLRDTGFSGNGEYEDVHEFIESFVVKETGIDTGGLIHTARSRNDQVVTAVRLKTRREVISILNDILELLKTLLGNAERHINVLFPFYTHLQQAQVAPLSHYFLGYFDILARDFERLVDSLKRINLNPLGSVAIVGTSLKIDRGLTTRLLGFDDVLENSFDAVSSRDFILEVVSDLNILMLNLSRMMEDMVIWLSSEFGYFILPDELAFPSSAMPNKKNPCVLELARARSGRVFSSLAQLSMICKAVPSGYVRDLQETKPPLIEAINITRDSIAIIKIVLDNLQVNYEKIKSSIQSSIVALDIAERIVEEARISFRLAHKLVGEMVRESIRRNKSFKDLDGEELRKISLKVLGKDMSTLLSKILKLDWNTLVSSRHSTGAGSLEKDQEMLEKRRRILKECYSRLEAILSKDRDANLLLESSIKDFLEGIFFGER